MRIGVVECLGVKFTGYWPNDAAKQRAASAPRRGHIWNDGEKASESNIGETRRLFRASALATRSPPRSIAAITPSKLAFSSFKVSKRPPARPARPPARPPACLHTHESLYSPIAGDSAFGFSGMELETLARYKLPVIIVVLNNSGIGSGETADVVDELDGTQRLTELSVRSLSVDCRYDQMSEALGGRGAFVRTQDEIARALDAAYAETERPTVINIIIQPDASRKPQEFGWLSRAKM